MCSQIISANTSKYRNVYSPGDERKWLPVPERHDEENKDDGRGCGSYETKMHIQKPRRLLAHASCNQGRINTLRWNYPRHLGLDGNNARLARRSDEALGVLVSVARIAPSFLGLERQWTQVGKAGNTVASYVTRANLAEDRLSKCPRASIWQLNLIKLHYKLVRGSIQTPRSTCLLTVALTSNPIHVLAGKQFNVGIRRMVVHMAEKQLNVGIRRMVVHMAEKQFNVGIRRMVVHSQPDHRSTSSLVYVADPAISTVVLAIVELRMLATLYELASLAGRTLRTPGRGARRRTAARVIINYGRAAKCQADSTCFLSLSRGTPEFREQSSMQAVLPILVLSRVFWEKTLRHPTRPIKTRLLRHWKNVIRSQAPNAVVQWLEHTPPTRAKWVRFPAATPPDLRTWESCRTMPLVGGSSRGLPVSPCSVLTSLHPHRLSRPRIAAHSSSLSHSITAAGHVRQSLFELSCELWAALNSEVLREPMWVKRGEYGDHQNARAGKREAPQKIRRPAAQSGTILTCEIPGSTQLGIEPGPPWWKARCIFKIYNNSTKIRLTFVYMRQRNIKEVELKRDFRKFGINSEWDYTFPCTETFIPSGMQACMES
ncbi:hypothetical protein PR048_022431 [Dryococelus australis]|uniref:Uncharacterized protein n=1 Tax=Dryococelus australis TaxID=614101 RepID=A0ABQ9H0Z6_9NEOP|nr:hypothetical protein PR048_022431 [Dryococelus australis]